MAKKIDKKKKAKSRTKATVPDPVAQPRVQVAPTTPTATGPTLEEQLEKMRGLMANVCRRAISAHTFMLKGNMLAVRKVLTEASTEAKKFLNQ